MKVERLNNVGETPLNHNRMVPLCLVDMKIRIVLGKETFMVK